MLARLESMKDRGSVEVDRSGTYIRVRPPGLAEEVLAVLREKGVQAGRLGAGDAREAEARATAWFSRANVRELSREEFRILSRRWAGEFREQASLSEADETRLVQSLDRGFDKAVDHLPRAGDLPDESAWRAAKAQAIEQLLAEARDYLSTDKLSALRPFIEEKLGQ